VRDWRADTLRRVSLDFALAQFDGEGAAVRSYAAARDRPGGDAPWTREVGFVEHHSDGRLVLRGTFAGHYVDVDEGEQVSQKGAAEGAIAGGLLGVLAGPPGIAVGIVVGGVLGSHAGASHETEAEPQLLADRLRAALPRSSSAIVLIAAGADVDEMIAALGDGAERVARQTLTADQASRLEASLSAQPPSPPAR
jgi:uncharacterized membrane protein